MLFLTLALLVNIVVARAVSKKEEQQQKIGGHHEPNVEEVNAFFHTKFI